MCPRRLSLGPGIALALFSLESGCLVEIRPATIGHVWRPGYPVGNIRVAVCSMTPARGYKCRSLRSTYTDEDGAFEFPSASALFPLHDLPCGEPAISLVAICHPEASRYLLAIPRNSPDSLSPVVKAFDDRTRKELGYDIEQYHTPESICRGVRLLPQNDPVSRD